ncbi:MAG: site-specific integrase, partial [Bacteroidota bacterium]
MLEQAFTDYLRVEKQYAVNTLQAYSRDLSDFAQFLETQSGANLFSHEGATSVDHRLLRSWMGELMSEGKGARTVARKLSCIKSYYHFLQKAGYVDHNPALRVKVPKFEKKLPAFLKETETEHLLDHLEFPTGFDGIRDRCLLEVLYGCGLRRAEVISLKKAEVDLYGRQIRVKGKGN